MSTYRGYGMGRRSLPSSTDLEEGVYMLTEACTVQVWAAYSPVKNSPADAAAKAAGGNPSHSATSGELDIYRTNCAALRMAGATIEGPEQRGFNGLTVDLWPRVSWSPFFAITFADLEVRLACFHNLHLFEIVSPL